MKHIVSLAVLLFIATSAYAEGKKLTVMSFDFPVGDTTTSTIALRQQAKKWSNADLEAHIAGARRALSIELAKVAAGEGKYVGGVDLGSLMLVLGHMDTVNDDPTWKYMSIAQLERALGEMITEQSFRRLSDLGKPKPTKTAKRR